MRFGKDFFAVLFLGFTAVLMVATAIALVAPMAAEKGFCVREDSLCIAYENWRYLFAAGIVCGLIALLFSARGSQSAFTGSIATLFAITAGLAVAPDIQIGKSSGEPAVTPSAEPQSVRVDRAIDERTPIQLDPDDLPFETEFQTGNRGLAAFEFSVTSPTRLRIDVAEDEGFDPAVQVFSLEQDGDRQMVARNDDGGDGRSARIEREFESGKTFIILVLNLTQTPSMDEVSSTLRISLASLENLVPPGRTVTLASAPGRTIQTWEGVAQRGLSDDNRYRVDIEIASTACLIADVSPTVTDGPAQSRDTLLALLDADLSQLAFSDDREPGDFGSRIIYRIEAGQSQPVTYLIDVAAYADDTRYSLYVELRDPAEDGRCMSGAEFVRSSVSE